MAIAGIQYATDRLTTAKRVLYDSLTIQELLDESPHTCQFSVKGFKPQGLQDLVITLGDDPVYGATGRRIFGGVILSVEQAYVGTPANPTYTVNGIDYTWFLTLTRVTAQFEDTPAAHIVQWLLTQAPAGFTMQHVDPDLDTVDFISFDNITIIAALAQLAKQIGEHVRVDYYKDVHLPSDGGFDVPDDLTPGHASLDAVDFTLDYSQVITRVIGEATGSRALSDCNAGDTILPVEVTDAYSAGGGRIRCGNQRITYTSLDVGGGGSLVGPGASPTSAPSPAATSGSGIESGVHLYAVTFITAAGESIASPTATVTLGTIPAPTSAPSLVQFPDGSSDWFFGDGPTSPQNIEWAVTFYNGAGETTPSPVSNNINFNTTITPGSTRSFSIHNLPIGPSGTVGRKLYRASSHGGTLHLVKTIADNTSTDVTDDVLDVNLGAAAPASNTATVNQVIVSAIPLGGSQVTGRKIYRTGAGGAQLKLLTTISNNITDNYTDSTPDASLGANVPTSDTSGLSEPSGQVLPGSTSLLSAGVAWAKAAGGWAVIGNGQQVIRYTGVSGNSIVGIPSSGIGSITASINYGSTITAAPALLGIPATGTGSILYAITKGDAVNLLVQVDDTTAQADMASLIGSGDGVIEDYVQFGAVTETEALAEATAQLALRSAPEGILKYTCRDPKTTTGVTVTANLTNPNPVAITGAFLIQQVTIGAFRMGQLYPTYEVQASTIRFTLDDLLRIARKAA